VEEQHHILVRWDSARLIKSKSREWGHNKKKHIFWMKKRQISYICMIHIAYILHTFQIHILYLYAHTKMVMTLQRGWVKFETIGVRLWRPEESDQEVVEAEVGKRFVNFDPFRPC